MLTKEQELASQLLWRDTRYKAVQIVAGAGSGKTTTLIESVLQAQNSGMSPDRLAMITFTRKAAFEMKERLSHRKIRPAFTGTMHSLAWHLLKSAEKLPGKLGVGHEHVRDEIIRELYPQYSHIPIAALLQTSLLDPAEIQKVENLYAEYKKKKNIFDYDDLIWQASCLKEYAGFFQALLVDEFQDTSPDQLAFINTLAPEKILAVGDDWQSIYKFRKSDVRISREFVKNRPDSVRLFLTDNFRSQKKIVSMGNRVIRLSSDYIRKTLRANFKSATSPTLYIGPMACSPIELFKRYLQRVGKKYQNLTILVRTNYLRLQLEKIVQENTQVMTIHSAKGLEFDNVLVFGIAHHIFPHRWGDYDEEVRLLYVAITRAKHCLDFLAWERPNAYSTFLPFLHNECDIRYL